MKLRYKLLLCLLAVFAVDTVQAQELAAETVQDNLNYVWTIIAACLVFFMQAGFTLVEIGFTRAKNAVNIIMKNVMDISAGCLAFFFVGFGLMFGTSGGWIGTDGFLLMEIGDYSLEWSYTFFFFQAVFAATAATIVSGAVAERTAFNAYLIFSVAITAFIYPVFGAWAWEMCIRDSPKTLAAAFTPVFVGGAIAWHDSIFSLTNSLIALVCAFLIQIGTNFANDYFDFIKGADTDERIGFERATASGLIAPKTMLRATIISMGLAFLLGLYLVWVGGWVVLLIGVLSLLFGILYTGGPYPLGYNGLGDIFVFIFFGIVAVMGTYYINAFEWSEASFWASLAVGALCTNILVINNLRDVVQDAKVGKRTLGVLFGDTVLKLEYTFMLLLAYAIPPHFYFQLDYSTWVFLPFFIIPLAFIHTRKVWTETHKPNLNKVLEQTAKFMALFGLLFTVGIILS